MAVNTIHPATLEFLSALSQNNSRDWFDAHKKDYDHAKENIESFYKSLYDSYLSEDALDYVKVYRIYRDIRFSKDKTPYKTHFGGVFHRTKPQLRGTYYLHIEPGNSFVGGGFWGPEPDDLLRIRKEFENDAQTLQSILNKPEFHKAFGGLVGDAVKTAPKGFDKNHPNIALIKWKQFIVKHSFTDQEVLSDTFQSDVLYHFGLLKPFFDYMTEILTTNLNGESLI